MTPFIQSIFDGARPSLSIWIDTLGAQFPLLHELHQTPQEPEWHGEGDVGIHTAMVLDEVYKLLDGPAAHLSAEQRLALILGAVFHDIAKPLATKTIDRNGVERIASPRHARLGRSYIAVRLLDLGLSEAVYQDVLAMVGHHHDVRDVMKEPNEWSYRKVARMVDLELLYFLEVADNLGRITVDQEGQLEILEYFKMQGEELGLWPRASAYGEIHSDLAKALGNEPDRLIRKVQSTAVRELESGTIFSPGEALPRSYRYRDGFPELVLMVGLSGSGKSHYIEQHLPHHHLIALDELRDHLAGGRMNQKKNSRIFQKAKDSLKEALRKPNKIVWDATNLQLDRRRSLVRLAWDYHAYVRLVVCLTPWQTVLSRNREREFPVPDEALRKQLKAFEFPFMSEADCVDIVKN
jgi:predicted kinase